MKTKTAKAVHFERMYDKDGVVIRKGDPVRFYSANRGTVMFGVVNGHRPLGQMVSVLIANDPFPVNVPANQLEKGSTIMPTATKPNRRELRRRASELGIEGWESLDTKALEAAVAGAPAPHTNGSAKVPARAKVPRGTTAADKAHAASKVAKAATKKTVGVPSKSPGRKPPAKRQTAPVRRQARPTKSPGTTTKPAKRVNTPDVTPGARRKIAENGNPYRPGSNLHVITELLLKGGRRADIINKLLTGPRKLELHPWAKNKSEINPVFEMDKRVLLACHDLKNNHNFTVDFAGRGVERGTVRVTPPGRDHHGAPKPPKPAAAGSAVAESRPLRRERTKTRKARKHRLANK